MDNKDTGQVPSLSLAYLGDAVYAVYIRRYLIEEEPYLKPNTLHQKANHFVSAKAQSGALHYLKNGKYITESEWGIAKKARNKYSATRAKNATIKEYRDASGLEALIGYLDLTDNRTRIRELMMGIIKYGREIDE